MVGGENMGVVGNLLKNNAPYMENSTNKSLPLSPCAPGGG